MIRRITLAAVGAMLLFPAAVAAQGTDYRTVLTELRDTTAAVRVAGARFERDLGSAAPETVTARARILHSSCRAARDLLEEYRPLFRPGSFEGADIRERVSDLRGAMTGLQEAIREHCIVGMNPEGPGARADTLRAWGPYRVGRLNRALADYAGAAAALAGEMEIEIPMRLPGGN